MSDVFRWCSNERDTSPADILSEYPRYAGIASRVSSVIALTPETRSGVFGSLQTMVAFLADPEIIDWIDPHRDTNGNIDERRGLFDPYEFATSEDTLYLLSAQGRPSTALTASLTAVVAFTAFQRAQSEFTGNNRRLPVPLCCVLDEAANICRWPELADVYSYFGSAGIPIMTIWQNPDQAGPRSARRTSARCSTTRTSPSTWAASRTRNSSARSASWWARGRSCEAASTSTAPAGAA